MKITLILLIIWKQSTDIYGYDGKTRSLAVSGQKLEEESDNPNSLDNSDWKLTEQNLLNILKFSDKSDCSYVENIISTNFDSGYMEIVVSPILHYVKMEYIQYVRIIFKVPFQSGDVIRVYKSTQITETSAFQTVVRSQNLNYVDTDIVYKSGGDYSAEYTRKNGKKVVTTHFNNAKPSWMWCMKDIIGKRSLGKLFLPGNHDSGSYLIPESWTVVLIELYKNMVFTQESTFLSQLMQGARSFDIRIGKYYSADKFYINHSFAQIRSFKYILDQIKEFLAYYPNEIILLDFHNFPVGFETFSDHEELVSFVKKEMGHLIYTHPTSATWSVTLDEIWKTKGRIIVAYNHPTIHNIYNLYPGVHQIWANKDHLSSFVTYMNANLPKNCKAANNKMTSAMAELTPTVEGVLFEYSNGVRQLASTSNSLVTNKFLTDRWGDTAQIVAVDFLESTGIVTAAIKQNALRAQKRHICH